MDKFPEVITVHVGEAGCRLGLKFWELMLMEQGLLANGKLLPQTPPNLYSESLFCLSPDSSFKPRAVFADTHPSIIDSIRNGEYAKAWREDCMVSGKESAGWNFARGYLSEGPRGVAEAAVEAIRRQAECCDALEAFLLFSGLGGGTGSAVSCSILRKLKEEFCKKGRLQITTFPTLKVSTQLTDAFNVVLGIHGSMDYSDCCFLVDNAACYDICAGKLHIPRPCVCDINAVIAQALSGLTAITRFPKGCPGLSIHDLVDSVVPTKRLNFPVLSFIPLTPGPPRALPEAARTADELARDALTPGTLFAPSPIHVISAATLFRGSISPSEVTESIERLKGSPLAEISSSKIKTALTQQPGRAPLGGPVAEPGSSLTVIAASGSSGVMINRATSQARAFWQRRAYVHNYTKEGLEIDEIRTGLENIEALVEDHDVAYH